MAKCHFGVQEVDFLGRTITTKGVAPQKQKNHQIPWKSRIPTIQESTSKVHRIFELLPKLHTPIGKTTHTVLPTTQNN